jgi:hypothetical protein
MSQGDHINRLRVKRILNKQTDLDSVLSCNEYTGFMSYMIANSKVEVPTCASFKLCTGTNERPYRVITMTDPMGKRGSPLQHGYNEYLVRQKANDLIMPCPLFHTCDEYRHRKNNTNKKVVSKSMTLSTTRI